MRLEGIEGSVDYIKDVSGPYYPFIGKPLDDMSCNTIKYDGFADLIMKFDIRKLSPLPEIGDVIRLTLTGNLMDRNPVCRRGYYSCL